MRVLVKSLIVTLAMAGAAMAQDGAARAQAILKQARAAIADESKLSGLKSLTAQGASRRMFGERQIETEVEFDILMPDKIRRSSTTTPFPGADIQQIEVLNGGEVWTDFISSMPAGGGGRGPGGRGFGGFGGGAGGPGGGDDSTRVKLEFTRLLLGMLAAPPPGVAVTYNYIGETKVLDSVTDVIEISGPGENKTKVFVDRASHQVVLVSYRGKDLRQLQQGRPGGGQGGRQGGGQPGAQGRPGGGQPGAQGAGQPQQPEITPEERERRRQEMQERIAKLPDIDYFLRFSEYKSVNGLNLPHLVIRMTGDQVNEEWAIGKYKVNASIKPDKFEKKEKK